MSRSALVVVLQLLGKFGNSCSAETLNNPLGSFFTPRLMAEQMVARVQRECPFCGQFFQGLGNHLQHCKDRQGRDYSQYLSKKTLQKKTRKRKELCPKCQKSFLRLETHLKNSASCRSISPPAINCETLEPDSSGPTRSENPPNQPDDDFSHFHDTMPQHLHNAAPISAMPGSSSDPPQCKAPLKLPSSKEDWQKANAFFKENLVPTVLQATSAEEKNYILADGIYSYFSSHYGIKQSSTTSKRKTPRHEKHDRALKKVTELKNKARKDLRQAKREGKTGEVILSLARNFFSLVRQQSQLKKKSRKSSEASSAKKTRQHCHKNFWRFARELLNDDVASKISPQFSADEAFHFFSTTYQSTPASFMRPSWMPTPQPPTTEFETDTIVAEEIQAVVKRTKSGSSPSPFDQVPYQVFKRCPDLTAALIDLFNCCWATKTIPLAWKTAGIKLLGKSSAIDNPSTPTNFRPIALTSCIGKFFTSILKNRWLNYMLENGYLDPRVQKAFMTATPGCTEHHSKLASILFEARKKHKSLAVAWLDLANAYGSVHHSLIQFSMKHYHAPPELCSILDALYSDLSATILTQEWTTPSIPLKIGVYQGDPLSVVVFNTVINSLVDTLQTRDDLGYTLSDTQDRINLLQYADDTCIVADGPATCQHLLTMVERWLAWSGMKAKVPKCFSLALQGSTGRTFDPQLTLEGQTLPFMGNQTIKFLGLPIRIPHDPTMARVNLKESLDRMLKSVDQCPVTRKQKLKLYKLGVCPRLNWPLTIHELPLTWIERQLEATATRYLKKWAGLAKPANPNLLYLPKESGGLSLPSLSSLYKQLQISRQCQLLTSSDPCVRRIAEKGLQSEELVQRKKFRPAITVRNTMQQDPSLSRKALRVAAKRSVTKEDDHARLSQLQSLPRQGHMVRSFPPDMPAVWAEAVQGLPDEQFKFALNAAHDTIPHNANLHLWKKKDHDTCTLFGMTTKIWSTSSTPAGWQET